MSKRKERDEEHYAILKEKELQTRINLSLNEKSFFLNREDLHKFIKRFFYFDIPLIAHPDNKGHSAPFDFIYDAMMQIYKNSLLLANRNGGKTIDMAIIEILFSLFFPECECTHSGSVQNQAQRCFKYIEKFTNDEFIKPYRKKINTRPNHLIMLNNSEVNITVATTKGYNSGHPHKNLIDEVELIKYETLQEALSMQISELDKNIEGQLFLGSTRKKMTGTMQFLLDNATDMEMKTYIWNIFDVVQKCNLKTKCEDCVIFNRCNGMARLSSGYYPLMDFINKAKTLDDNTWDAQWVCKRPGSDDLVYPEFNDLVHIMTNEHERSILENIKNYTSNWCYYRGIDPGFNNPYAVLFIFKSKDDEYYILDEIYATETLDEEIADLILIKEKNLIDKKLYCVASFFDPAKPEVVKAFRRKGITNLRKAKKDVIEGIKSVKRLLKTNIKSGKPKIFISKKCINLIFEFHRYANKKDEDAVVKEFDHGMDALRYVIYSLEKHDGVRIRRASL